MGGDATEPRLLSAPQALLGRAKDSARAGEWEDAADLYVACIELGRASGELSAEAIAELEAARAESIRQAGMKATRDAKPSAVLRLCEQAEIAAHGGNWADAVDLYAAGINLGRASGELPKGKLLELKAAQDRCALRAGTMDADELTRAQTSATDGAGGAGPAPGQQKLVAAAEAAARRGDWSDAADVYAACLGLAQDAGEDNRAELVAARGRCLRHARAAQKRARSDLAAGLADKHVNSAIDSAVQSAVRRRSRRRERGHDSSAPSSNEVNEAAAIGMASAAKLLRARAETAADSGLWQHAADIFVSIIALASDRADAPEVVTALEEERELYLQKTTQPADKLGKEVLALRKELEHERLSSSRLRNSIDETRAGSETSREATKEIECVAKCEEIELHATRSETALAAENVKELEWAAKCEELELRVTRSEAATAEMAEAKIKWDDELEELKMSVEMSEMSEKEILATFESAERKWAGERKGLAAEHGRQIAALSTSAQEKTEIEMAMREGMERRDHCKYMRQHALHRAQLAEVEATRAAVTLALETELKVIRDNSQKAANEATADLSRTNAMLSATKLQLEDANKAIAETLQRSATERTASKHAKIRYISEAREALRLGLQQLREAKQSAQLAEENWVAERFELQEALETHVSQLDDMRTTAAKTAREQAAALEAAQQQHQAAVEAALSDKKLWAVEREAFLAAEQDMLAASTVDTEQQLRNASGARKARANAEAALRTIMEEDRRTTSAALLQLRTQLRSKEELILLNGQIAEEEQHALRVSLAGQEVATKEEARRRLHDMRALRASSTKTVDDLREEVRSKATAIAQLEAAVAQEQRQARAVLTAHEQAVDREAQNRLRTEEELRSTSRAELQQAKVEIEAKEKMVAQMQRDLALQKFDQNSAQAARVLEENTAKAETSRVRVKYEAKIHEMQIELQAAQLALHQLQTSSMQRHGEQEAALLEQKDATAVQTQLRQQQEEALHVLEAAFKDLQQSTAEQQANSAQALEQQQKVAREEALQATKRENVLRAEMDAKSEEIRREHHTLHQGALAEQQTAHTELLDKHQDATSKWQQETLSTLGSELTAQQKVTEGAQSALLQERTLRANVAKELENFRASAAEEMNTLRAEIEQKDQTVERFHAAVTAQQSQSQASHAAQKRATQQARLDLQQEQASHSQSVQALDELRVLMRETEQALDQERATSAELQLYKQRIQEAHGVVAASPPASVQPKSPVDVRRPSIRAMRAVNSFASPGSTGRSSPSVAVAPRQRSRDAAPTVVQTQRRSPTAVKTSSGRRGYTKLAKPIDRRGGSNADNLE